MSVLPSKNQTTIKEIFVSLESVEKASSQMAATLLLEDEIDISRGDVIVPSDGLPEVSDTIEAKVCWMSDEPLWPNRKYVIKLATASTKAILRSIDSKLDIESLSEKSGAAELKLNDIGTVHFQLANKITIDTYANSRGLGGFIIIDEVSNITVGAGLVISTSKDQKESADYSI